MDLKMDRREIYEKLDEINTQLWEATHHNPQPLSDTQKKEFKRVWLRIDVLMECL